MQDRHGVHYHTYWFDPETESVFCLAEGPSRESVVAVHRESHGLLASVVLELESGEPLNAFMGSQPLFPVGTAYTAPALRVIVFTDIRGSVAQTHDLGDHHHVTLLREHDAIVREELVAVAGREVKHTGDGIMAAFDSAAAAVQFARGVQRKLRDRNHAADHSLDVGIGISAGEPVTDESGDLFGAAVQLAARLCGIAAAGEIVVTGAVRELCAGKLIEFRDRGHEVLKGIREPVATFAAAW